MFQFSESLSLQKTARQTQLRQCQRMTGFRKRIQTKIQFFESILIDQAVVAGERRGGERTSLKLRGRNTVMLLVRPGRATDITVSWRSERQTTDVIVSRGAEEAGANRIAV